MPFLKGPKLLAYLSRWMEFVASKSSIHGIPWYGSIKFLPAKIAILFFAVLALVAGPLFIIYEADMFFRGSQTKTMTELVPGTKQPFPVLTICNPLFFSSKAMEGVQSYIHFCQSACY